MEGLERHGTEVSPVTADFDSGGISDLHDILGSGSQGGVRPDANVSAHRVSAGPRVVIVLLDVSASMAFPCADAPGADDGEEGRGAGRFGRNRGQARPRRRIDILNERLQEWLPLIRDVGLGDLRHAEMAVITFGGRGVRPVTGNSSGPIDTWHTDDGVFVPLADLDLGKLQAFGTTPLAEAIETTLDLADARVRYLAGRHVSTGPVRVLMFADGGSYDRGLSADNWQPTAARVAALRRQGRVQFFAFGVPGADESTLREIAGEGYAPLLESGFGNLLDLILRTTAAEHPFEAVRERFGWGAPGETAGGGTRKEEAR